jgi:xylose isomerase
VVDALAAGGYDGPVHFDYKPPRTEDDAGVWASAAACMRNYLILREKVRAFRADPDVIEALQAARVAELSLPTLGAGESWRELRGFTPDIDALAQRGMAFERLDQLALEHLYGTR